ncbi:hypothetical protein SAMN02745126_04897 [Enhydrobacter aerosaccus]|uniref:Uncharacterized protein n=1 Tax=Enhydrobacter aerosaccus TaxID=225324 RepID=A0A1T4SQL4_9HYPH|nr:hypothetical protein [Enhydrobacter aerosaccus]SKA30161.1 hypothetical protein SAMN02745126_04897 [Enhydrobacter aerosaccus]
MSHHHTFHLIIVSAFTLMALFLLVARPAYDSLRPLLAGPPVSEIDS